MNKYLNASECITSREATRAELTRDLIYIYKIAALWSPPPPALPPWTCHIAFVDFAPVLFELRRQRDSTRRSAKIRFPSPRVWRNRREILAGDKNIIPPARRNNRATRTTALLFYFGGGGLLHK